MDPQVCPECGDWTHTCPCPAPYFSPKVSPEVVKHIEGAVKQDRMPGLVDPKEFEEPSMKQRPRGITVCKHHVRADDYCPECAMEVQEKINGPITNSERKEDGWPEASNPAYPDLATTIADIVHKAIAPSFEAFAETMARVIRDEITEGIRMMQKLRNPPPPKPMCPHNWPRGGCPICAEDKDA